MERDENVGLYDMHLSVVYNSIHRLGGVVMQRTQIYLDDELNQLLRSQAKMQGKGLSELIRQLLHQSLKQEDQTASHFFEQLLPLESFTNIDPTRWVKNQRSNSRILRGS